MSGTSLRVRIIAVLILLGGCAALAWHRYSAHFTNKDQEPLFGEQIESTDENAQEHPLSQPQGGYTLALESTIVENGMA